MALCVEGFIDFQEMEAMPANAWYADIDGIYHFSDGRLGFWSPILKQVVILNHGVTA